MRTLFTLLRKKTINKILAEQKLKAVENTHIFITMHAKAALP